MAYYMDGIGNELFAFIFLYCCTFLVILIKSGFSLTTLEYIKYIWQYLQNVFRRRDRISLTAVSEENDAENQSDQSSSSPFDVRIFNTDCCVCLTENCNYPVASICGHCFCGTCAVNLIEHSSFPMKCPVCRQECRALFLPFRDSPNINDEMRVLVMQAVETYNARTEHRFPFVNRVRNAPIMLRHLMRSFSTFQRQLIFRLQCHVIAATFFAICYVVLPTDLIPENVFGLIGFIDDLIVIMFLTILVRRTYRSIDSPVSFDDIRASLE